MICFARHHSLLEELLERSTYVWDAESNAINNKIFKLKFDPTCPGSHQSVNKVDDIDITAL